MGGGGLTHAAAAVIGFTIGALVGYAGAGDSKGSAATATDTATFTATETSAANEPDATRRPRSGEIPGDGTYLVGKDIQYGTYRTEGPQGGLAPPAIGLD